MIFTKLGGVNLLCFHITLMRSDLLTPAGGEYTLDKYLGCAAIDLKQG